VADPYNPFAPGPGQAVGRFGGQQFGGLAGRLGTGPTYGNAARGIVQQGGQAGFFNPMGSPQILAAVRQNALRNAQNRLHRGALLSRLLGLDPQQSRAAQLGFEQQAGGDISNALLGAQNQQLLGSQDFIRSLFGQGLQGEQQMAAARAAAKAQQGANAGGIGSFLGRIGASFLPFSMGRGGGSAASYGTGPAYPPAGSNPDWFNQ
jgi:hypothetical protein